MPKPIAVLAMTAFTLFLCAVGLGIAYNTITSSPIDAAEEAPDPPEVPSSDQATYDAVLEAGEAALVEREADYSARMRSIGRLAEERTSGYQAALAEADSQLVVYDSQIQQVDAALQDAEGDIASLEAALAAREALRVERLGQLELERSQRLGQLQLALDDGHAKLRAAYEKLGIPLEEVVQ